MTSYKLWFLGLLVGLTQLGCSTTSGKDVSYRNSVITPTLEIPPDLISRSSDKNLELPGSKVGTAQNIGRFVETGNLNTSGTILPVFEGVRLEGQEGMYWLVLSRPVEEVYPLIRQFWVEQGFKLGKDEPLLGLMETEWLGFKAGKDSFFGNLLSSMRAAESLDQYHVRLERSAQETRVYLTHRASELVIDQDSAAFEGVHRKQGWQRVPSDRAKEVEALSRLMLFFGMQDEQVKQTLGKLAPITPRASLVLDEDNERFPYLMVHQGIEQAWNRLLYQLDRQSIVVVDKEKGSGKATLAIDPAGLSAVGLQLGKVKVKKLMLSLTDSVNTNRTRIEFADKASVGPQQADLIMQFLLEQLK